MTIITYPTCGKNSNQIPNPSPDQPRPIPQHLDRTSTSADSLPNFPDNHIPLQPLHPAHITVILSQVVGLLSPFVSISWVEAVVPFGWVRVEVWDWMIRWTKGLLAPELAKSQGTQERGFSVDIGDV